MSAQEGMTADDIAETIDFDAGVIRLQKGDVLLFRSPDRLSADQSGRLNGILEKMFPGHEILILDAGCDLVAIRPADG